MIRQFEYPLQLLPDTDLLNIQRNVMVEVGGLMQAVLGTGTVVDGFACTATTPAALQVLVGPGSIFSQQNLDSTAYGSLPADTTHTVIKQGRNLDATTLSCPAPSTSGQSINYLIEGAFSETDTGVAVLNYFNSANPTQPYTGPGNNGAAQPTKRATACTLQVKAGVAATTGSQTTPAPDTGFVPLWVVTVANGQTTITSGNIALAAGAPFFTLKLPQVQTAINAGPPYVLIQDQKAAGTNGGTFTSGAWRQRDLTTKVVDTQSIATLASNQVTLPAGTYRIKGSTPGFDCDGHQCRLQNITDGTTIAYGTTENSTHIVSDSNSTRSVIEAYFTITGAKTIQLQHQCVTTVASTGFGVALSFGTEVYSTLEIWKVA